jgi:CxxC motif-containing protein (DUF1111 family)
VTAAVSTSFLSRTVPNGPHVRLSHVVGKVTTSQPKLEVNMRVARRIVVAASFAVALTPLAWMQAVTEAPTGFDNLTNGHTDQATMDANRDQFEEVETNAQGIGPVFNMRGCAECHGNPVTGGISPITELRAGRFDGTTFTDHPGGSLIHSQAINAAIQEHILGTQFNVRTFRTSLNTLGDGFVEAVANGTFTTIRNGQPSGFQGTIISVPVVEAGGTLRVGRFGWKNQHASLLSFSGDAYLNEMGITNLVNGHTDFAHENTSNGNSVAAFDAVPDPENDGDDVEAFAEFMRSAKAPPRGPITASVQRGDVLFDQMACAFCHTRSITTAAPGTSINGGQLTVDAALGNKVFHPFGDFMLHDLGTGDGIVQNGGAATRNMVRTAPLWGVRTRNRLMHDGESLTFDDAILRHGGVGGTFSANNFRNLSPDQKTDLVNFLKSL